MNNIEMVTLREEVNSEIMIKNPDNQKKFNKIDMISQEIMALESGEFVRAITKANAIKSIRNILSDDIMKNIKSNLENNKLGFKTDNKTGYDIHTIRECLIEATLRGLKPHDNEFNIISGNMYATKEGLTGFMARDGRFKKLSMNFGIPEIDATGKRAIVNCSAKWEFAGEKMEINEQIPIKINTYMGDDAIIGKANRKLRARIIEQSLGWGLGDGEVDDVIEKKYNGLNKNMEIPLTPVKEKLFDEPDFSEHLDEDGAYDD